MYSVGIFSYIVNSPFAWSLIDSLPMIGGLTNHNPQYAEYTIFVSRD